MGLTFQLLCSSLFSPPRPSLVITLRACFCSQTMQKILCITLLLLAIVVDTNYIRGRRALGRKRREASPLRPRPTSHRGFALKVQTSTSQAVCAQTDLRNTSRHFGRTGFTSSAKDQTVPRRGRIASAVMEPSLTGTSILAKAVLT